MERGSGCVRFHRAGNAGNPAPGTRPFAWPDVVELTAYLTNLRRDFALFMDVRNRFIGQPYPAMTMIGIAELAQPGLICEVKGIAAIPEG